MTVLAGRSGGLARLGWTAGIVVAAGLPHLKSLPLWMPVLLVACLLWRFLARIRHWPLPGRWMIRLLTVAALAAVLFEYRTVNGLAAGSALLFVMLALKFLEARSQRDELVLTVLACFLVFASILEGGGPLEGLYLLGFAWLATLGLLQLGRQGRLLGTRTMAGLAGRLLLPAVPIMLLLFLLFPRLPGPIWSVPTGGSSASSGLSGSMSPGDITSLGLSDEIAFWVEFSERAPGAAELYWRGPVLSNFDGRRWTATEGMRRQVQDTVSVSGAASRYRITLEPGSRGYAFALEMPESWRSEDRRQQIVMRSDYELRFFPSERGSSRLSYSVTSYPRYRAMEPLNERERANFTRLPPDLNPRTRALVDGLVADLADPAAIIEGLLDVFRQQEFFYTLTPPPLGLHTADDFLFETREGFCEHYASVFTIMLRMAGLPARVVTGYQGGELNPIDGRYVVRQSDAHAWTEVWTADAGWSRVDPISAVAPERIAFGLTGSSANAGRPIVSRIGRMTLLRQAVFAWEAASNFWDERIIGYGPAIQQALFDRLGFERPNRRQLLWLSVGAIITVMFGLALWLGPASQRRSTRDPAAIEFRRFARGLERRRVAPPAPGETPSAYAARAGASLPADRERIIDITGSYLRARYEADPEGRALEELRAKLTGFRPGRAHASH